MAADRDRPLDTLRVSCTSCTNSKLSCSWKLSLRMLPSGATHLVRTVWARSAATVRLFPLQCYQYVSLFKNNLYINILQLYNSVHVQQAHCTGHLPDHSPERCILHSILNCAGPETVLPPLMLHHHPRHLTVEVNINREEINYIQAN